jgi:phage-related protein (TIGR01555 family)
MKSRSDGYANLVTGVSTEWDKPGQSYYSPERTLSVTELGLQYETDSLASRVVDRLVDDATRCTWRVRSKADGYDWASVQSELEDRGALRHCGDAWRWARLYGGALAVLAVNDGQPYGMPLDLARARDFTGISVIDSTCVIPDGFNPGLGSTAFSQPKSYTITVPYSAGGPRQVHPSRVIRFDGIRVPSSRMIANGGWGPSLLQRVHKDLRRLGTALGYAEALLQEISVMVLRIPGLREMLCSAGGESDVKQMLSNLRWSIDALHILAIEGGSQGDDFHEVQRSVNGVSTLIDRFVDAVVRATGMPRVILLGEQPGGLNADAKGETRAWYDYVESQQKQVLAPALNRLIEVALAIRARRGESVPSEWTIEFESLVTESRETAAATLATWADAHAVLIDKGIETPAEAREIGRAAGVLDLGEPEFVEPEGLAAPAGDDVASQALNGAQVTSLVSVIQSVQAGQLAPAAAELVIRWSVPSIPAEQISAAVAAAHAAATASQALAGLARPAGQAIPGEAVASETDELEPNETDLAWESAAIDPGDLAEARVIAEQLGVPTGRITRAHRAGEIRGWNFLGGKARYSMREVKALILAANA